MAVKYITQKCTSCAGTKFTYLKDIKMWSCDYCGALMERNEQADNMFTIKNIVRQVLLDVAYIRMENAQKNLTECDKIDSRYAGTLIAHIAYEMNMIIHGDITQSEQRNMFALLKKHYSELCSSGDKPGDDEMALYDSLESAEAFGVLVLVYDSLRAEKRLETVFRYFDASSVYSLQLNTDLLNYSIKHGRYDDFDKIVYNKDNINKKKTVFLILSRYPDGEKKREYIKMFIIPGAEYSDDDRDSIENYLRSSSDSAATKSAVTAAAFEAGMILSSECVMEYVISQTDSQEEIRLVMNSMISRELPDIAVYTIFEYAIGRCSDENCEYILGLLHEKKVFVNVSSAHFCTVLSRKSSVAARKRIMQHCLAFNTTDKIMDRFVTAYLCDIKDTPENRADMIPYLLSCVETVSTICVERYLNDTADPNKAAVIKMIFSKRVNRSFFRNTLSGYIINTHDAPELMYNVVYALASEGLSASSDAVLRLINRQDITVDRRLELLHILQDSGCDYNRLTDMYIASINNISFSSPIFGAILSKTSSVSGSTLTKYLFEIKDMSAAKFSNMEKLLNMCMASQRDLRYTVNYNQTRLSCNILQAYTLISCDDTDTAVALASMLTNAGCDISARVDTDAGSMKFKKFIARQRAALSATAAAICSANGLL